MVARRGTHPGWGALIVTSGLAVTITAFGTYLTDRARVTGEAPLRRCELASTVLLDETPSPYMDQRSRAAVVSAAVTTLERCLREQ
jgi:hypothetical protein